MAVSFKPDLGVIMHTASVKK